VTDPSAAPRRQEWLSLGPASRALGVDPDTLRRWANDGRITSYTTPGGHRRFDRLSIERIAASRRAGRIPLATLGATPQRLARAYRRTYRVDPRATSTAALAEDDREAYRLHGRRLIVALIAYLDAPTGRSRSKAEEDATSIVDALADRLSADGLSLTDGVELFVAARRPFLAELGAIGRRRAVDPARLAATFDEASAVLDRLLLRLISTHQALGERP
jgi:excisionase family DNA binding protein